MKNLATGTGLVALSAAILVSTIIMRYGPAEQAAHAAPPLAAAEAIAAAATAQVTPTIVWYGQSVSGNSLQVCRAWSNGRIEAKIFTLVNVCPTQVCNWTVLNDSNQGYNAAADIDFDSKVDGNDLGQLLAAWGDAPRHDIPPSDCPLNLVNP